MFEVGRGFRVFRHHLSWIEWGLGGVVGVM
jgi:hypothetical protein